MADSNHSSSPANNNNKGNNGNNHHHGGTMLTRFQLLLLLLMVIQNSCTVLIGRFSRNPTIPKNELYSVNHLIMISEITKFVLSCMIEHVVQSSSSSSSSSLFKSIQYHIIYNIYDTCKVLIPALLYIIQTSLLYVALSNLTAPIFQVTYQMKLVTTALLSVLMLPNRSYNIRQWICLILLSIGVAIVVLGEKGKQSQNNDMNEQNFILGLCSVILGAFSSALAGVYFEKVLKTTTVANTNNDKKTTVVDIENNNHNNTKNNNISNSNNGSDNNKIELVPLIVERTVSNDRLNHVKQNSSQEPSSLRERTASSDRLNHVKQQNSSQQHHEPSLWMRNIQLSFFSIILAAIQNAYQNYQQQINSIEETELLQSKQVVSSIAISYFHGFTIWVWLLVLFQAGGGLLVAAIIKYADNVVKGLATGVSIIVATLFSIAVFPDSRTQLNIQFILGSILILWSVYYFSNPFPTITSSHRG